MDTLDVDTLSTIFIYAGQESWPIISLISQSMNRSLQNMVDPLVERLIARCSVVSGTGRCIYFEAIKRHYMRTAWQKAIRRNERRSKLMRSILPALTRMSIEF